MSNHERALLRLEKNLLTSLYKANNVSFFFSTIVSNVYHYLPKNRISSVFHKSKPENDLDRSFWYCQMIQMIKADIHLYFFFEY
jgi:hypothetical protein